MHKPRFIYERALSQAPKKTNRKRNALFIVGLVLIALAGAALFLKELSTQIALSDATDTVTLSVNSSIADIMHSADYGADAFVTLEKNDSGAVSAISCNMARINALSAEILDSVIGSTESRSLVIRIPAGNLIGMSLLTGKGPMIPVEIVMLTSSRVEFGNNIITAGINQTKHQIDLRVIVDVDVFVPWGTESTQIVTDVLIADTVIVGQVPDTYLDIGE